MRTLGAAVLGVACAALLMAPMAQGHTLTKKKARSALQPVVTEITPQVAPAIVAKMPGSTVAKSRVGPCTITKKGHRAECVLVFSVTGGTVGEAECALDARVDFKNKRSKELEISLGSPLICLFPVEVG